VLAIDFEFFVDETWSADFQSALGAGPETGGRLRCEFASPVSSRDQSRLQAGAPERGCPHPRVHYSTWAARMRASALRSKMGAQVRPPTISGLSKSLVPAMISIGDE